LYFSSYLIFFTIKPTHTFEVRSKVPCKCNLKQIHVDSDGQQVLKNSNIYFNEILFSGVVELVLKVSNKDKCSTSDCRSHDDVKDLVACKIITLTKKIDPKRHFLYTYTEFKAKAKGEASKFVFSLAKRPKPLNETKAGKGPKVGGAAMVRYLNL